MDNQLRKKSHFSQTRFLVVGFLLIITIGSLLLMTPIASSDHTVTPFLDCLFTSVSATCVTGLVVTDTFTQWSMFGQLVILCMIQIGGLGFITIGVMFSLILRQRIGLKMRGLLQESVNTVQIGGVIRLAKKILKGTLIIEGAGALILSIRFSFDFGVPRGIYYGVFHSVSAFCNAGFDLFGINSPYESLTSYAGDPVVNIVIPALVIIGGIGFMVWDDITINKLNFRKYHLHTKVVLITTAFLLVSGTILFYIVEYNNTMQGMNVAERIMASFFSSVTARTAGFNTIDTAQLLPASKLLTIVLMFIGGSPGSTAGGIKTTTIFVLIISLWASINNKPKTAVFRRRFEDDAIRKASTVFMLNLLLAVSAVFIILACNRLPFDDIIFEVFSAIGTVGMSTGITRELNTVSRIVIMILMFCGRVGSLSFALSFLHKKKMPPVYYPEEKISIG
ncbi:MAG: TrkH family potassium uptake protein [Butyrivibrio sp.]